METSAEPQGPGPGLPLRIFTFVVQLWLKLDFIVVSAVGVNMSILVQSLSTKAPVGMVRSHCSASFLAEENHNRF